MNLEELQQSLEALTDEIKKDNFQLFYDKFAAVIKKYKSAGGKGKPAYEILWKLWIENNHEEWKDEILGDTMSKMGGYCSPFQSLEFPDFNVMSEFDIGSGKFK